MPPVPKISYSTRTLWVSLFTVNCTRMPVSSASTSKRVISGFACERIGTHSLPFHTCNSCTSFHSVPSHAQSAETGRQAVPSQADRVPGPTQTEFGSSHKLTSHRAIAQATCGQSAPTPPVGVPDGASVLTVIKSAGLTESVRSADRSPPPWSPTPTLILRPVPTTCPPPLGVCQFGTPLTTAST